MVSTLIRRQTLVALFFLGLVPSALHGQYLRVTGSAVNVRERPTAGSTVIGTAEMGEIFQSLGRTGEWYGIELFSGESRYIHASLAQPTESPPALSASEATRRTAFEGFLRAEDRSFVEAEATIPVSEGPANTELQRILDDRYKLKVCKAFPNIQPVHFELIKAEGEQKGWDRIGEGPLR